MAHVPIWQIVEAPHVQVFLLNQAHHPEKKKQDGEVTCIGGDGHY